MKANVYRKSARTNAVLATLVSGLMIVALSACGNDSSDEGTRRFANERPPTFSAATATAAASTEAAAPPTAPPVVSPGALLATRGAPKRLFFTAANELWTVGADGTDPRPLLRLDSDEGEIRGTAQAPGVAGNEVAALVATEDDGRETASVVLLDGEGAETRRVDALESVLGDDAAESAIAQSLTWSPQGNELLVTFSTGGIVRVPIEGDPSLLLAPDVAQNLAAAAWSPAGDAIAFLAEMEPESVPGALQLVVAPVSDGTVNPDSLTVASRSGDSVSAFAWLPDGSGLLYSERVVVGTSSGGDLFSVHPDGDDAQLIASAGRAAPVAQIVAFAVSPDGQSLAYTIATPDSSGEHLLFHSLWVRSLDGTATVPVPVPSDVAVTQLWWSATGLVWRSQLATDQETDPDSASAFSLERLDAQSQQSVLFAVTPAATPAATPDATSEGSPGTELASPEAAASPVDSTPAPADEEQ